MNDRNEIRKVLGASVIQIASQLSQGYVKLVAWFFDRRTAYPVVAKRMPSSFAYRVEIGATILIMAAALSASIAGLAVGLKSVQGCDG